MRKFIIIVCALIYNSNHAQPYTSLSVKIDAFFVAKKGVYFSLTSYNTQNDERIYKQTKTFEKYSNNKILLNMKNIFVYKADTMRVKLISDEYFPIEPVIQTMYFKKGTFIIDINECIKIRGLFIENFPCDCMAYRKEEETK